MTFKLFDRIRLKENIPNEIVKKGMLGTIIEVFETPRKAFEVEFVDDGGRTRAQLTLEPHQIEPAHES